IRSPKVGGVHHLTREDTIAKSRREPLDLIFDSLSHVDVAICWDMAVGPKCVPLIGRACFIEQTLLCQKHEWTLGNFAARYIVFRSGDFVERAAEMDCAGLSTFR